MYSNLLFQFRMWPLACLLALPVSAELHADEDAAPGAGFDFSSIRPSAASTEEFDNSTVNGYPSVNVSGFIKEEAAYSYQHDDFDVSKTLSSFNLAVDINLNKSWSIKMDALASYDAAYSLEGREKFTQETLDVYEKDFRLREFYTDIDPATWMNIRVGRQYFGWGESDNNQISDIGNPRDLRELGLQDVSDIRLPVGASKLTLYGSSWEYNLIAIHEIRPHELGPQGSEYDPFLAARSEQTIILEPDEPSSTSSNTEYLTRIYFSRSWGDTSFFWGKTFDDFPILEIRDIDLANQRVIYQPIYQEVESYGFFGNVVAGSWLFKFDVAKKIGKPLSRSIENVSRQIEEDQSPVVAWQTSDLYQWMLGIEYNGLSETYISLSLFNQTIDDYADNLLDEEQSQEVSLFISRDFMNDRITASVWWNRLLDEGSDLFRIDVGYDYNDHINYFLALNGIESDDQENYYYDYRKTDRLTLGIKYVF